MINFLTFNWSQLGETQSFNWYLIN